MNDLTVKPTTSLAALGTGQSVLGETRAQIPIGGKIRSGIKVLTSTAAKFPKAVEIYQRGTANGRKWDEIEKEIREATGMDKSPMTPKNVPYFTARHADFAMAEVADMIMDRYAEDRGDGRRLYRFPIVLPLENWMGNMPHGLKCFTKSELVYWSEYGSDGFRYCYTRGTVEMDQRSRRARKSFGGRPLILRADNDGRCNPDVCPEYQAGKCKLSGGIVFYIPGIPGSSAIQLPTTSFYSLSQWRQQMEMVAFLRGRVSGVENGQPVFYLAKRQEEVSMIDPESGRPKRVKQYLVKLEANIDMTKVFADAEAPAMIGVEAARMLTVELEGVIEPEPAPAAQPEATTTPTKTPEVKRLRAQLFAILQRMEIDTQVFADHMARQKGEAWSTTEADLNTALDELAQVTDIPAYVATISVPF